MIELILNPPLFLIHALLGGLLIAFIAAPLGVFMVWQRQSYFGAALAHSALLGLGLGLFLSINLSLSVILVSLGIAVGIHLLKAHSKLSSDTLLGILAHSSLALGLILLSLQPQAQLNLMAFLFGDILSIDQPDLIFISFLAVAVAVFFKRHWQDLLNTTLNAELAQIEGIQTQKVQLYYVLLLALMIAMAMKMVGALLITSLLIIPAATARKYAQSPEQMLGYSLIFGGLSVIFGVVASLFWDIPTGASIVAVATLFFLVSLLRRP